MKIIAYLAPEIPALSATFVYNEILGLEEKGYAVVPISVHVPGAPAQDERVAALAKRTHYLYRQKVVFFLLANIAVFLSSPVRFLKVLSVSFRDAFRVGIGSRTGAGVLYRFFVASFVARILREKRCEHLHAHFAHVPTDIAMYAAALSGVPFSFTSHANDLFERGWLLPEKVDRAKFAATISEFNREFLVSLGARREKIHIVRCGVDSKTFIAKPLADCLPPYMIGTLGRMVEKKGFDVLLRAADILVNENIDFRLVVAGGGPLEFDLKQLSWQLGIEGVVDFIGPLPHEDVPAWLKTLDLFVLPCQKDVNGDMDGIPVVLMEAMLSGVPVVSTELSGIPELIENENEGLLVDSRSHEPLASAIQRMLIDHELRERCAASGVDKVMKEFDAEVNIQRCMALFG